jgi:hypothetical protein
VPQRRRASSGLAAAFSLIALSLPAQNAIFLFTDPNLTDAGRTPALAIRARHHQNVFACEITASCILATAFPFTDLIVTDVVARDRQ